MRTVYILKIEATKPTTNQEQNITCFKILLFDLRLPDAKLLKNPFSLVAIFVFNCFKRHRACSSWFINMSQRFSYTAVYPMKLPIHNGGCLQPTAKETSFMRSGCLPTGIFTKGGKNIYLMRLDVN